MLNRQFSSRFPELTRLALHALACVAKNASSQIVIRLDEGVHGDTCTTPEHFGIDKARARSPAPSHILEKPPAKLVVHLIRHHRLTIAVVANRCDRVDAVENA